MRVVVIGGSGNAGGATARALRSQGDEVVLASRATGVDAVTGEGLAAALDGADVAVDASGTPSQDRAEATRFFTGIARNLQQHGARAGVRRIVTLSIYGIDGLAARAYYAAKLAQERAAREGDVESVVLRATQFHDFPHLILRRTRLGPLAGMPRWPVQTVDVATVGVHLMRLAHETSPDPLVNLAGPEPGRLDVLARRLVRADGLRLAVIGVPLFGEAEKRIRAGALVPDGDAVIDGPSFSAWCTERAAARRHG